jgi:rRNA maturation RNase YbeY
LLKRISETENKKIESLGYVFYSDDELLELNISYLNHNTYTDIITFDLGNTKSAEIIGEIYISRDRVKENANTYGVSFEDELIRVISHGLLHLMGYKDKSTKDAAIMREQEERCLSLWREISSVSRETITF